MDKTTQGSPDYPLFAATLLLVGSGIAAVLTTSLFQGNKLTGDSYYFFTKQAAFVFIGLLMMFFLLLFPREKLHRAAMPGIGLSIILLLLVFVPGVGKTVNGATSWLDLSFFSFQPSEPVKLFLIIYLADFFSHAKVDQDWDYSGLVVPLLVVISILVLVLVQSDLGTALHIFLVAVVIFFVVGFPVLHLVFILLFTLPLFYIFIFKMEKKWRRVLAFLDPFSDPTSKGYQLIQSLTAFYYGGFWGKGLGNGVQKSFRLPEPHTDFIFAATAEELGLLWSLFIIFLFIIILVRGVYIINRSSQLFDKILGVGIITMILSQAVLNMGVVTGSLPITGIPLPFISYGGSHLITSLAGMGILLNISREISPLS